MDEVVVSERKDMEYLLLRAGAVTLQEAIEKLEEVVRELQDNLDDDELLELQGGVAVVCDPKDGRWHALQAVTIVRWVKD
jgi:hypothetical protein